MKKYFLLIVSAMMACSAMFYVSSCSEDTPMSEGLTKEATKAKAEAFAKKYNIGLSLNDEAFVTGESNEAILEQFKKDVITLSAYKRDTIYFFELPKKQTITRKKLRINRLQKITEAKAALGINYVLDGCYYMEVTRGSMTNTSRCMVEYFFFCKGDNVLEAEINCVVYGRFTTDSFKGSYVLNKRVKTEDGYEETGEIKFSYLGRDYTLRVRLIAEGERYGQVEIYS